MKFIALARLQLYGMCCTCMQALLAEYMYVRKIVHVNTMQYSVTKQEHRVLYKNLRVHVVNTLNTFSDGRNSVLDSVHP